MVSLVELSGGCILLPSLILHFYVVGVQVLRVQTVSLLVLFSELVLISLVLCFDVLEIVLENNDLLIESGNLSNVCLLDLLVLTSTAVVQLLDLTITIGPFSANSSLETLYLALPLCLLLSRLFLVLLQVLLLLVTYLSELFGAAI